MLSPTKWLIRSLPTSITRVQANALLFVNGFGGTPAIELYLMYNSARKVLEKRGLKIQRSLVGSYVTSLEMAGSSVTVTLLDRKLVESYGMIPSIPPLCGGNGPGRDLRRGRGLAHSDVFLLVSCVRLIWYLMAIGAEVDISQTYSAYRKSVGAKRRKVRG